MDEESHHDPVSALAEEDAVGRTAKIFAEIREVMEIPMVTSIWRTLTAIENGLETAWAATRPLYESGGPQFVFEKLKEDIKFPVPEKSLIEQYEKIGFNGRNRSTILSLLKAYNRSNSLNLIALSALVSNSEEQDSSLTRPASPARWETLPSLLPKDKINASNWELLEKIKYIGASFEKPAMPTLWRHLIHWPDLVENIYEAYLPLHKVGTIDRAIEEVRIFVESEAPAISRFRVSTNRIPKDAFEMIRNYVGHPPSVSRMVTVGNGVEQWLER